MDGGAPDRRAMPGGPPPDAILGPRCGAGVARSSHGEPSLDRKFMRNGLLMLLLVVGTAALLFTWLNSSSGTPPVGYGTFLNNVTKGEVKSVEQEQQVLSVAPKSGEKYTVVV